MKSRMFVVAVLAMVAVVASPVLASDKILGESPEPSVAVQPAPSGMTTPPAPETWGTSDWVELNLSGSAFVPLDDANWGTYSTGRYFRNSGSNSGACADVTLPSGALVAGVTFYLYDTSTTGRMESEFRELDWLSDSSNVLVDYETTAAGQPGWVKDYEALTAGNHTVDNDRRGYRVCTFQWTTAGTTLGHYGVSIWYHRQVSPAPATATFGDVPTSHSQFRFVEALAASGITGGCGGGNYCPDSPLTRGQMAVFLSTALGLHFPDF